MEYLSNLITSTRAIGVQQKQIFSEAVWRWVRSVDWGLMLFSYSIVDHNMGLKTTIWRRESNASINAEFPPLGKTIYVNMCSCMVYSDVTGERTLWFSSYICNNHGHLNSHHNIVQGFMFFQKGRPLKVQSFIRG